MREERGRDLISFSFSRIGASKKESKLTTELEAKPVDTSIDVGRVLGSESVEDDDFSKAERGKMEDELVSQAGDS